MKLDRRLIEETIPIKEISFNSAKEKNIRQGHISTLHLWWARRPLGASRATNYAALISIPKDNIEKEKHRKIITDISKWENSLNFDLINLAKNEIIKSNKGVPPKIIDPFGGGGSIPLEALRLGCETYSNDYNPVSVLIQKCLIEFPFHLNKNDKSTSSQSFSGVLEDSRISDKFISELTKWGSWVYEETKKEIGQFFYYSSDDRTPVAFIWARTINCQNPQCNTVIPLIKQFWLAKKKNKLISLYPQIVNNHVQFTIVGDGYKEIPENFNPSIGTVKRAVCNCLVCGSMIEANQTRKLFQEGKTSESLIAVVEKNERSKEKKYTIATKGDISSFNKSRQLLALKQQKLTNEWGIDPIPNEPTPMGKGSGAERAFSVRNYGLDTWGDLYNSRQLLSMITFIEKIRLVHTKLIDEGKDEEYAKAMVSYLGLILSRHSSYNASLCWWEPLGERSFNVFGRQTLPIVFDYSEQNPFEGLTGSWRKQLIITSRILKHLLSIKVSKPGKVTFCSATKLPYEDNYFDAVFTDPPYYDNVPYSYLSDFFYIWLKRTLGHIHIDLFSTPLVPKQNEIVAYSNIPGGFDAGKNFFEENLMKSFKEIQRILKPNGIAIIVYAHKSTAGWETLVNSLLDSNLIITEAWPIHTEMITRLRANESAALASSIYIIARKMKRRETGFLNDVKDELKNHLNSKLNILWEEGIGGADFFIAAIGSAIEVFGKYEQVIDYEGNIVRADKLLAVVRKIATDYAVRQILHNGFSGEISDLTRYYVLFRWEYGEARIPFDDAKKLAQSCHIDLSHEWDKKGFVKKEKEFIRLLGPKDRKIEDLKKDDNLIDVLHRVLLLWEKGDRDGMRNLLQKSGFGKREAFYRVAQAISETLGPDNKEKKLLDGFLAGRERIQTDIQKDKSQTQTKFDQFGG